MVLWALADRQLAAGIAREEVQEVARHNDREDLEAARHTDQVVVRRVQRAVAEVAGSRAEGDHHIVGLVEGLAVGLRSLLGTAGLVEGRIRVDRRLAVGVLLCC